MINATLTGELPNGYWLDENIDAAPGSVSSMYILGVTDGLLAVRHKLDDPICIEKPVLNRDNIVKAVRAYYTQNPENKFRQIAAVIRSGCM